LSELVLSDCNTEEVIGHTSTEQEWGNKSGEGSCDGCENLDEGVWGDTGVETCRVVVE
jgi:hypothetical protein